jgi:hypothetical protein
MKVGSPHLDHFGQEFLHIHHDTRLLAWEKTYPSLPEPGSKIHESVQGINPNILSLSRFNHFLIVDQSLFQPFDGALSQGSDTLCHRSFLNIIRGSSIDDEATHRF